jgi:hypothetical protein
MPRVVPLHRTVEKAQIWNRHAEPVGFKIYGTVKRTRTSQPEHIEYSIVETRRKNPRALAFLVRHTIGRMIYDSEIPPETDYKTYDTFIRLHGLEWQKVHKVLFYNVTHTRT